MDYIKSFLFKNWYYFVIAILCLSFISYLIIDKSVVKASEKDDIVLNDNVVESKNDESKKICKCKVDIKGEVKKPGVYEFDCNITIDEALLEAGGITKNGYTNNINLSKSIENEMVIYVYSKSEIKKMNSTSNDYVSKSTCESKDIYIDLNKDNKESVIINKDNQIQDASLEQSNDCDTVVSENNITNEEKVIININEATKEELMTITGIGESKALNIISYRQENGLFKDISEIKNVSGIGDALFEKIKDYIKI